MTPTVGVLALQGEVGGHLQSLSRLGAAGRQVRGLADLHGLTHLVMPGGESTTLRHLLDLFGMSAEIVRRSRAGSLALLGTCAGAILLGKGDHEPPERLGLLDVVVDRNAYGRQVDSFVRTLDVPTLDGHLEGVFIRAPRIRQVGPGVRVLAWDGDDPVLVEGTGLLAATFHPELTDSVVVHEHFLSIC